jgi:hypothetical protein
MSNTTSFTAFDFKLQSERREKSPINIEFNPSPEYLLKDPNFVLRKPSNN